MQVDSVGTPSASGLGPHAFKQAADMLKHLDRCARAADGHANGTGVQRSAIKQQVDNIWRQVLAGACNISEASHRAAYVAGLMLGGILLPEDLSQARRMKAGLQPSDPCPMVAASLYAMLDALEMQENTDALEDAFASLNVQSNLWATPPNPWHPNPPGAQR